MGSKVQAGTAEATIVAADLSTSHEVIERDGRRRKAWRVCEVVIDGPVIARVRVAGGVIERRRYETGERVLVRETHAAEVERVRSSLLDLQGAGRRS